MRSLAKGRHHDKLLGLERERRSFQAFTTVTRVGPLFASIR